MSIQPSVSVVMAAYNASDFIHMAIESLQRQTLTDWELIIVDDCSQDNTKRVVEEYQQEDGRICYERMPENKGPAAARNLGFHAARGKWLTVLDSDDRYAPDRLKYLFEQASVMKADIVGDNLLYYDATADKIVGKGYELGCDHLWLTAETLVKNDGPPRLFSLGIIKPLIRKEFWLQTGIFYAEDVRVGEDFCFLFLLLRKGAKAVIFNKAGYIYTMPFGRISRTQSACCRTDYNQNGWRVLFELNERLRQVVLTEGPANDELVALFDERKKCIMRDMIWRKMKNKLRQKNAPAVIKAFLEINMLPYVCGKIANRFRKQQSIRV